jgi:hypothetical protein
MTRPMRPAQNTARHPARRRTQAGQTIVLVVVILGVLAILGLAFASIIGRNVTEAARGRDRAVATDLARAGTEYAHYQLRYAALGADWRPEPVNPADYIDAQGYTKDPDAYYLRPADPNFPVLGTNRPDLGGPDGEGPFSRIFFDKGRALIRVRFAPSSFDAFADPTGQLREPGRARSYLVIETIGRPGPLTTGGRIDPSRQLGERVRVLNFANLAEKQTELGRLGSLDFVVQNSRKLMAFASIGIIESGRYITNKDNVSRPAEIGFPTVGGGNGAFDRVGVGALYGDGQAPFNGPQDVRPVVGSSAWGRAFAEPNQGRAAGWATVSGGGSLWSNADLTVHGRHDVALNAYLGESWAVAGKVAAADDNALLRLSRVFYDRGGDLWRSNWPPAGGSTVVNPLEVLKTPGAGQYPLDSEDPAYDTLGGVLRDGRVEQDLLGYPRGVSRKAPPSALETDPANGQNRYLFLTRESGRVVNGRNIGRFGYGRGVYVDSPERGNSSSEDERIVSGAVRALPNDWLNPNNASSQGWRGPYYIPLAPHLRLLPDGFEIVRDSRSRVALWRNPNGSPARTARCRFRVLEYRGQVYIVNSIEHPDLVGQTMSQQVAADIASRGVPFNGVVMFEGDVRVRGVIPTDHQITVVSRGSIYVEGSVTKGVVRDWAPEIGFGQPVVPPLPLTRPSRSTLMLIAKDYSVVNTTMFFGPAPGEAVNEKAEKSVPDTPNPFELTLDSQEMTLQTEFLLDPETPASLGGNPNDPSTWRPFANNYLATGSGVPVAARFMLGASADDNGPAFVGVDLQPDTYYATGTWSSYLFPRTLTFGPANVAFNAAGPFFGGVGNIPVYGLGNPLINSYPKFESIAFTMVDSTFNYAGRKLVPTGTGLGTYELGVQDRSLFRLRRNDVGQAQTKNFLGARSVVAPADVRIEAAMFAEEGSFFVIPGHWFNMNSDDTRQAWLDRASGPYAGLPDDDAANRRRFELYGNSPSVPFFGEPVDVKVTVLGAVSENMPAPIGQQAEWLRKWGWIPRQIGSSGLRVPTSHTRGTDVNLNPFVPNLSIVYDPVLATASHDGANPVRRDANGWVLAPMPRLPVSPTLAYIGEVNP